MKGWFTDRFFRTREHTAQVETVISPSDCAACNRMERNILAARHSGNPTLAAAISAEKLKHCRADHGGKE